MSSQRFGRDSAQLHNSGTAVNWQCRVFSGVRVIPWNTVLASDSASQIIPIAVETLLFSQKCLGKVGTRTCHLLLLNSRDPRFTVHFIRFHTGKLGFTVLLFPNLKLRM